MNSLLDYEFTILFGIRDYKLESFYFFTRLMEIDYLIEFVGDYHSTLDLFLTEF